MWIRRHNHPLEFSAVAPCPYLREREKKPLLRSEPVNLLRRRLPFRRFLQGGICNCQSAQVRDAFTFHQFAVFVQTRFYLESVKLFRHAISAFLEVLQGVHCPPVFQIALGVELSSLIVKTMRHLVTDYGSHSSVIHRIVAFGIVKGWL